MTDKITIYSPAAVKRLIYYSNVVGLQSYLWFRHSTVYVRYTISCFLELASFLRNLFTLYIYTKIQLISYFIQVIFIIYLLSIKLNIYLQNNFNIITN